jgi:hypothetical protein
MRRRHHQRLGRCQLRVDGGDDGDAEGAGLSTARPRLDDQVAAALHRRNGLGLDGHRLGPAEIRDAPLDVLGEAGEARKLRFGQSGRGGYQPPAGAQRESLH